MDYKHTLNLPETRFPMQGKLPEREPGVLARWRDGRLYARCLAAREGRQTFILHDGPPYANGVIHIGHAVNKVLKDIVNKSRLMAGLRVPYVPGWDCHGLPIEIQVERQLGRPGEKVSAAEFRRACRAYAASQVTLQKADFQRLGILGDWDNPYLTMDHPFEADIIRELGRLVMNGAVYRGAKPVHWCVDCGSALAEAEVEYQDRTDPAIDVAFGFADPADLAGRLGIPEEQTRSAAIVIWTTTPWTLPANEAVAVHPDYRYQLIEAAGRRLILATELAESALARYGHPRERVLAEFPGRTLEGLKLHHPFLDKTVPVILGEHVTLESGTGSVHTAPAHGQEDYEAGLRYGLPVDNPVGDDGVFRPEIPFVGGQKVFAANTVVVTLLKERGALLHFEKYPHSYPHCWRHKTPLIFRATPQWFIGMEWNGLREKALRAVETTRWVPDWGAERIGRMVADRPDWCISRQRAWGVPIALFACERCGEPLRDGETFARIAQAVEAEGVEAWFSRPDGDFLPEGARCAYCGHEGFRKVTDVLDVWFDSGSTHACVLERRPELSSPADLYLEGADQHRGWFQSSLLESVATRGHAPYRAVLTHGFTVDGEGRKMSKSLGNVIAPQEIIGKWGADILRLWVAASDYRSEIPISDGIVKQLADSYRRIRNTARYILGNCHDFDPASDGLQVDELLEIDRWALARTARLQDETRQAYEDFHFLRVQQRLHHFCAVDLGGFYIDVLKDRLYTTPKASRARRSAQTALWHILEAMVRWMAPILSFTAEEIWEHMQQRPFDSVFLAEYPTLPQPGDSEALLERFGRLLDLRGAVNQTLEELRKKEGMGAFLEAELTLYADEKWQSWIGPRAPELRFLFLTSEAELRPLMERDGIPEILPGLAVAARKTSHPKCARCWHHRPDVGTHAEHPGLCGRCVENIVGTGGRREYI